MLMMEGGFHFSGSSGNLGADLSQKEENSD
jgi:hypothetical protein